MLLRELWAGRWREVDESSRSRKSDGGCRDSNCCMMYDVTHPEYPAQHVGNCRHWLYYQNMEVYLDDFADDNDYRLALSLACHLEAYWAIQRDGKQTKAFSQQRKLNCGGYSTLPGAIPKLKPDDPRYVNAAWMMTSFTCIALITHYDDDQSSHDIGSITIGESKQEFPAILVNYEGWYLITTCPVELIHQDGGYDHVYWIPAWNILNYVRRFTAVQRLAVENRSSLAHEIRIRSSGVRGYNSLASERANALLRYCQDQLDKDQFEAYVVALRDSGLGLIRGPFGCGKTRLIAAIAVTHAVLYRDKKIAIVSETNAAIDEDLCRIVQSEYLEDGWVLRLGDMRPSMKRYSKYFLRHVLMEERQKNVEAYQEGE